MKRMYARDVTLYPQTMEIAIFNYPSKEVVRKQGEGVRMQIFKLDERRFDRFSYICVTMGPSAIPHIHPDGTIAITFYFGESK